MWTSFRTKVISVFPAGLFVLIFTGTQLRGYCDQILTRSLQADRKPCQFLDFLDVWGKKKKRIVYYHFLKSTSNFQTNVQFSTLISLEEFLLLWFPPTHSYSHPMFDLSACKSKETVWKMNNWPGGWDPSWDKQTTKQNPPHAHVSLAFVN